MARHIVLVKRGQSQQFCLRSMAKASTHACSSCMKLGRLRKKNFEERQTWAMVSMALRRPSQNAPKALASFGTYYALLRLRRFHHVLHVRHFDFGTERQCLVRRRHFALVEPLTRRLCDR